jgi:hypothetical protein
MSIQRYTDTLYVSASVVENQNVGVEVRSVAQPEIGSQSK